ncbi:MAG: hypothetical protein LC800_03150 [Acidobacteria bacterium]|nr:hypothetical protein [Acidobacteriota bacterium]
MNRNMRRALPLLLLLVASLSACSYSTYFVVANESDVPVEVYYTLKERRRLKDCCDPPAKKTVKQLQDSDAQWRELDVGEYRYDEGTRGVTVTLRPQEVLRVTRMSNYFAHGDGRDEFFDIESVRVTGAHGSIQYSGREARTQFVEGEGRIFAITYR